MNAADQDGATALHHAVAGNQIAVVKLLLERKANANATKKDGVIPLYVVAALGRAEIAVLLLKAGADEMIPDRLVLDVANERKQPELSAILAFWSAPVAQLPDPQADPEAEPQQPAQEEHPAQASLPKMPTPDVLRRSPAAVHAYFT